VVGKKAGIANHVVANYATPLGGKKPDVPESYKKDEAAKVELDNSKCRFEPHVLIVRTSQTLVLQNTDAIGHNVKADLLSNSPFNDLIPAGAKIEKKLVKEEKVPMTCSCSIHPWMRGYLVVRDDPYAAVTDSEGNFEIKNLPAGKWTLRVWHEMPGFVTDVTVGGKSVKWAKGQVEVTIEDGKDFDFGEIKVSRTALAK
jgi:plastocyanin